MAQLRIRKNLQLWVSPAFDLYPTYRDMSGFLRHLTSTNPPDYGGGALGNLAWVFNGTDMYFQRETDKVRTFLSANSWTAIIALRLDGATLNDVDLSLNHGILGSSIGHVNGGGVYARDVAGEKQIYIRRGKKEAHKVVTIGQWYTIIAHRRPGQARIGLDPADMTVLKAGGTDNWGPGLTARLRIARNHDVGYFEGAISEIIIYRPGLNDADIPTAWAAAADKVLDTRGDPEEQMRDLVTRRALISEKLNYGAHTHREFWTLAVGDDLALTHRNILLRDGTQSEVDLARRYEARAVGRELDLDEQSTVIGTEERQRLVAYSSLRAERVSANHDGLLLTGMRLQQSGLNKSLVWDPNGHSIALLESGVKKLNVNGWQVESGHAEQNTVMADNTKPVTGWTLAGGAKRAVLPTDVSPLFPLGLKIKAKQMRTIFMPLGGTASVGRAINFNALGVAWIRFYYIGEGEVEITADGGAAWDFGGDIEDYQEQPGGWGIAATVPLVLPLVTSWTEFLYGPLPVSGEGGDTITWRSATLTPLRLGYVAATQGPAIVATDSTPGPPSNDFVGQGDNDDAAHIYFPLTTGFADEGAIRFKFAPHWNSYRWDMVDWGAISETDSRMVILRINRNVSGDPQPNLTIIRDMETADVELWQQDGTDLVCRFEDFVFLPGVKHTFVVAWASPDADGVPPYLEAGQCLLFIDGNPPDFDAGTFVDIPFDPVGNSFFLAAEPHASFATIMPEGSYSDIIITTRVVDVFADKMLEVEAS